MYARAHMYIEKQMTNEKLIGRPSCVPHSAWNRVKDIDDERRQNAERHQHRYYNDLHVK